MSRNVHKANGTRHESWLVTQLKAAGHKARRLAEGGRYDEGDVETFLAGERWVFEAKARTALNVQETLGKTRSKAKAANDGTAVPVAVVWKRLVRVPGLQVRQPVNGERVVVCVAMDDFLALIERIHPCTHPDTDNNNTEEDMS
jgi:hypothetical protein